MGIAPGVSQSRAPSVEMLQSEFQEICDTLAATRPTAVNLFWAIARMKNRFEELRRQGADLPGIRTELQREAQQMLEEDIAANVAMGGPGASLIQAGKT